MAEKKVEISPTTIAIILLIIALLGIFILRPYIVPPVYVPKYTKGLTAKFSIYDVTTYTEITANVGVEFYPAGTDPLGTRTFVTKPIMTASYSATLGAWKAALDAGTYVILIKDTRAAAVLYPQKYTVTVEGTDSEDKEVWLNPSQLNVYSRAGQDLSKDIKAYNETSGAYDISVATINITTYDKWLTTYTITIKDSDTTKIIKAGRLYLTKIPNLIPTSASLDGATVTVVEDTEAADDGKTGYYIEYTADWEVGEIHRLDIYWEDQGASTGSLVMENFEFYACLNTKLRWWTAKTIAITVES